MAMTNFFSQVAALEFEGCLNLTLKKEGGQLTVSVLLQNPACGDTAKRHIPPLILKGTPKELGEGFFPNIAEPVQATSQLLVNMEQFLKGQDEAKKQSALEKKKAEKTEKPATQDPKEKNITRRWRRWTNWNRKVNSRKRGAKCRSRPTILTAPRHCASAGQAFPSDSPPTCSAGNSHRT